MVAKKKTQGFRFGNYLKKTKTKTKNQSLNNLIKN